MSQPLGVHSLVWTGETSVDALREAIGRTRSAGFGLLELNLSAPSDLDVAGIAETFAMAPVAPGASLALRADHDVSSTDLATVRRGEELLLAALDVLHAVGGTLLCGVLYSALGKYTRAATPAGRANAVAVVRQLAQAAAERGMRLALEVVNRYESNLFNTCADALRFIDEVGEDNVSVHLDTYHMNIEEDDMSAPVLLAGDRLGYVHVGESHRGYLGSGTIDFPTFFRALDSIGYDRVITFESFSSAVVNASLSGTLAVWRNLWTDSDDLARHAVTFIRGQLTAAGSHNA
ncbi:sugar phosphate isomerase/epimerase [Planosporangium thailandense]|uniref:Sugar phosphate isomerase/epimerase n=1 Tax=Planosporangium thailandense TaxID=765197 RepID=A0ABX0XVD0_9ACTN|nr:sugar phosphate isomerase/epimerase [Planosporangium thailandense]NJC69234.1 sugar phosphate isomerase/epimerase [Planosporangium thailandense]